MSDRKPISKTLRFEIFKRDAFTCQYCGNKPPAVVLEVDHVIPVAEGGGNEDHNLITSCFDCNRGKGATSLSVIPQTIEGRAELIRERQEQVAAFDALLREQKSRSESAVDDVARIYEEAFRGWMLSASARISIDRFIKHLAPAEVERAMEMACARKPSGAAFKYFCGICWRCIKEGTSLLS